MMLLLWLEDLYFISDISDDYTIDLITNIFSNLCYNIKDVWDVQSRYNE